MMGIRFIAISYDTKMSLDTVLSFNPNQRKNRTVCASKLLNQQRFLTSLLVNGYQWWSLSIDILGIL